jgi:hypothetical protein
LQDVQRTFAVVGLDPMNPAHSDNCIKLLYTSLEGSRTTQRIDKAMKQPGALATWPAAVQTFFEVFSRASSSVHKLCLQASVQLVLTE